MKWLFTKIIDRLSSINWNILIFEKCRINSANNYDVRLPRSDFGSTNNNVVKKLINERLILGCGDFVEAITIFAENNLFPIILAIAEFLIASITE